MTTEEYVERIKKQIILNFQEQMKDAEVTVNSKGEIDPDIEWIQGLEKDIEEVRSFDRISQCLNKLAHSAWSVNDAVTLMLMAAVDDADQISTDETWAILKAIGMRGWDT